MRDSGPTAVPTRERSNVLGWWTVVLLMALAFSCHFNRISMSVAGNERIIAEYQISEVQMGTIYSAYLLVYTLCMIPGGWLIDRHGSKVALTLMGLGTAAAVVGTGGVGLFLIAGWVLPGLLVVRAMTGMFSAPMHPAAARSVSQWVPEQSRTLANGMVTMAALLGIASTYYLFGTMIDRWGWPQAFVVTGLATFGLAIVWLTTTASRPRSNRDSQLSEDGQSHAVSLPATAPNSVGSWHSLLFDRSLMLLTLSYAAVGYFQYLFFFWLEYYFDTVLELDRATSRLYTTIPMLAMAGGMLAGGLLADAIGRRIPLHQARARVAMSGMLGGTLFLALGVLASDPIWIVVSFSCAMGAVGMSEGPFWVTAVQLGQRRGGMAAAIFNTGGNLGGMLAPVATPWLSGYLGWRGSLPVAGLFCCLGAVLWLWIRPPVDEPAK